MGTGRGAELPLLHAMNVHPAGPRCASRGTVRSVRNCCATFPLPTHSWTMPEGGSGADRHPGGDEVDEDEGPEHGMEPAPPPVRYRNGAKKPGPNSIWPRGFPSGAGTDEASPVALIAARAERVAGCGACFT